MAEQSDAPPIPLEALRLFGLPSYATIKEVKAKRDALAKQHHPDWGGDTATMAQINAAYDDLAAYIARRERENGHRQGGQREDAYEDDDDPWNDPADLRDDDDGAGDADASGLPMGFPDPPPFNIALLEAIAGGGKTRELTRELAQSTDARAVIGAPTIDLINEIQEWLKGHGCTLPVTVVHSRGYVTRAVRERIRKWFEHQAKAEHPPGILIASHSAMLDLMPPTFADRYDLTFDEVPDITGFALRQFPRRSRFFTWMIATQRYRPGVLRLVPAQKRGYEVDSLMTIKRNHPVDEYDTPLEDLAAALLDPDCYVLVTEERWLDLTGPASARKFSGECDILTLLHPRRFSYWKSLTIAGALASDTMTCLLWRHLFRARFVQHPLQSMLPCLHTNGPRLRLQYFFEERATRSGLALGSTKGESMQSSMCKAVAEFYDGQDFLWSLPQPKEGGGVKSDFYAPFKPTLRLSGKSLGQNKYRDHTRLALLSVVLFTPGQYDLLLALGLSQEQIDAAHGFYSLHQDLMRSNLRVQEGTDEVTCVVPCLPSAQAVAAKFPGCTIERMPDHLIPQRAGNQKRGPKPSGKSPQEQAAERQRRRRHKQRAEREQAKERAAEDA